MLTPQETNDRIEEAFRDPATIQAAIERGIAKAIGEHAKAGRLLPSWENGKLAWLDPVTFQEVPAAEMAARKVPQ